MFKDLYTEKASVLNFSFPSQKQQKGPRYFKSTHTFNWVEIHEFIRWEILYFPHRWKCQRFNFKYGYKYILYELFPKDMQSITKGHDFQINLWNE